MTIQKAMNGEISIQLQSDDRAWESNALKDKRQSLTLCLVYYY